MAVPYIFATATSALPLSELDGNFATPITLGVTALYLGNTVSTVDGLTLTNVTISTVATPLANGLLANSSVTLGSTAATLGSTVYRVNSFSATPRTVTTTANLSSYTINTDVTDLYTISGQVQNATISTSGAPVAGQQLLVQISCASGAPTVTWDNTKFKQGTITGSNPSPKWPTSFPTAPSAYLLQFVWSDITSKWLFTGGQFS